MRDSACTRATAIATCRFLINGGLSTNDVPTPSTFYRHGADALVNAAGLNQDASRDGRYMNFPYTLQEVVDAMRGALDAYHLHDTSIIEGQAKEFEYMSTAR